MEVKNIKWISKEAEEAEVTISDGIYELICFAHPFRLSIGDVLEQPLYAIFTSNIQRSLIQNYKIEKYLDNYSYYITAQLFNLEENILKLGNIFLELDMPIPIDIKLGEYITFYCDRIDIMG